MAVLVRTLTPDKRAYRTSEICRNASEVPIWFSEPRKGWRTARMRLRLSRADFTWIPEPCQRQLRKSARAVGSRSTASKRRDAGARPCLWTRRCWRNYEHDFLAASVKRACEG
jgi:hypothetical protein